MKLKKIFILILLILIICSTIIIDAIAISPHRLTIREETISSNKISESLNGITIAFFSDLHFLNYINENDINNLVETINSVNPDVVIFGGDLVDNYCNRNEIKKEDIDFLISKLSEINSIYGKYAVLGNHDIGLYNLARETVSNILTDSGFNVITNTNVPINTKGGDSFNIVGIDSEYYGNPDLEKAYENLNIEKYTFSVSHCPDLFDLIDTDLTDYFLSAHSHGCQIYIPLINYFYRKKGAKKYVRGKYKRNNTILDITNGVGLSTMEIRLFADAEVVFYKLQAIDS